MTLLSAEKIKRCKLTHLSLFQLYFSMDVLTNKWCELSTMFVMIGGRWLLPRGDISRDQLSALLLEFISIAADILEVRTASERGRKNGRVGEC